MAQRVTRRELLKAGAAAGAGAALTAAAADPVIARALGAAAAGRGSLTDVEHVVILMQENRSFDHYFGTLRGVRGFSDRIGRSAFTQAGFARKGFGGKLVPFHLADGGSAQSCSLDITHEWGAQHRAWNGGAMDRFVAEHLASDGAKAGPLTMGYYDRKDVPFYYALADAFTICDRYHCSVIGPTDPNRLYSMSATLDPDGQQGGPLLETLVARRQQYMGRFTWTTMPEQLSARGISWKVYTSPQGGVFDNVLPYFQKFQTDPQLQALGMKPTYPADFKADLKAGRLPQVSWILAGLQASEHPGFSAALAGEVFAREVLAALTADRKLWAKTALLITWDENGGFFDHVAPPVAPEGTPGEYLTVSPLPDIAQGITGPVGLGFRVPLLVISPFSRGGYVCSDVFDHTSLLRLLETRFGAEVPNLSAWRRSVTGDLTSAFSFGRVDRSVPKLPKVALSRSQQQGLCSTKPPKITIPPNHMPRQERGRARRPVR
jgi:phospholipase C